MTVPMNANMAEATRLTREGRLDEALSLLKLANEVASVVDSATTATLHPSDFTSTRHPIGRFALAPPNILPKFGVSTPAIRLPAGARFETRSYSGRQGNLTYKVYIPSNYSGEPLPLVVMLHGCKQSPDDFAVGTRMNEVAEERRFFVAYPAQSVTHNQSNCWNWFRPTDQQRGSGEPDLIAGMTRQIIHDFAVDANRVYIAGLSAGGAAAAIIGSAYPDIYAAIGVHSGLARGAASDVASAFAAMNYGGSPTDDTFETVVPTIVFHGDRDRTVNPVNADQVIAQSPTASRSQKKVHRNHSADGAQYTRTVYADDLGNRTIEQWVLHGIAHAWSGGSRAGSYTDPSGVDASREMVRFFLEHPRLGNEVLLPFG